MELTNGRRARNPLVLLQSSAVTARSLARSQSRAIDRLETPPSDDGSEDFSPYAEAPPQIMLRMSEGGKHNRGGFEVYPPLATVPASFMAERCARARSNVSKRHGCARRQSNLRISQSDERAM